MAIARQLVQRVAALFRGHDKFSGTHGVPEKTPGSLKWTIKKTAKTLREEPTEELWRQHLEGARPLGVVPIRADNTCLWGSIDVDEYDLDLDDVVTKAERAALPLVPVRSKSGGLHLFLFFEEPESGVDAQNVLRDVAAAMGLAQCEIFPKQTRLVDERDAGSWMVMPYFGDGPDGSKTDGTFGGKLHRQHGLKPKGGEMTLSEFLRHAERSRTTVAAVTALVERVVEKRTGGASGKKRGKGRSPCDFSDGPPCMQHLCGNGMDLADGRKTLLFNVAVYLKRADPDGWAERLDTVNQRFSPPLPSSEIDGVVKSISKKDYEYQCKMEPLVSYCNSGLCRTRRYGVGAGGDFPVITSLQKREGNPPMWRMTLGDVQIDLGLDDIMNYNMFLKACLSQANKMYRFMQHAAWLLVVGEAIDRADPALPPPPGMTVMEEFQGYLEQFLTNRGKGERKEDLLIDKPWLDDEERVYYFTTKALLSFLKRMDVKDIRKNQIATLLDEKFKATKRQFNFDNKHSRVCWGVPADTLQEPPLLDPPAMRGDDV